MVARLQAPTTVAQPIRAGARCAIVAWRSRRPRVCIVGMP